MCACRFELICALSVLISIVNGSAAKACSILNGSFELPGTVGNAGPGREQYLAGSVDLTNWSVMGDGDILLHKAPDIGAGPSFNFAEEGDFYLDLSGSYHNSAHATVSQDFDTIPLATFQLSFYIGSSSQQPPAATINVQLTGAATLLNTTLTPFAASTNINWSLRTYSFVADSTSTRLSFLDVSTNDDNTSFVDNVSVVSSVPEPSSLMLLAAGALSLGGFGVRRRRAEVAQSTAE